MKTKTWLLIFAAVIVLCLGAMYFFAPIQDASFAQITSHGEVIRTVSLDLDQEFTVDGKNTVTVKDGKIAVTWAECPDQYCVHQGFQSGGTDIVCLPNRLVITFLGEQAVDGVAG